MATQITVRALEEKILLLEDVVITIRAPSTTLVGDYDYQRKAAGTMSVSDWLEGRVKPVVGSHEVAIVSGNYTAPHGRTKLSTLRDGYEK